jgi:NADH-quinone oxidoreductase subunit N
MFYGFLNAAGTDSLKRLLAYGSINQVGYIFMGLACGTFEGVQSALIYLFIYVFMLIVLFGLLLNTQITAFNGTISNITDLSLLYKNNPLYAWAYFSIFLSMGGIPPFAGFLGKYYLFLAVLHAELYILGFMGLLVSAASMFVYLKIIKVAIFEVPLNSKLVYLNTNSKLPVLIINFGLIYLAA